MKHIVKILSVAVLALAISSCSFTDIAPTDSVGDAAVFKDVASLKKAVIGCYSKLNLVTYLHQSEWGSDNCLMGGQSGGNGATTFVFGWTATSGDYSSIWTNTYSLTNEINRILVASEDLLNAGNDLNELRTALSEIYFLRAYAYYELLRFFSDMTNDNSYGIPYVTSVVTLEQPGRDNVKTCYDMIIADCEEALKYLPDLSSNRGTASKAAVYGLLARMYFYRNDFNNALSYADKALALVPVAKKSAWPNIWTDKTTDDVIWKLIKLSGQTTLGTMFFTSDKAAITESSDAIAEMFYSDPNDIRGSVTVTKAPDRDDKTVNRVIKFQGANPTANCGLCDMKMLRASEMMLIKIEATAQSNVSAAATLLNDFKRERYSTYTDKTYGSKQEIIDDLINERRREFTFEGMRWFDARHYGFGYDCPSSPGVKLTPGEYKWIMPIPDAEMQANFTIAEQQNPGY